MCITPTYFFGTIYHVNLFCRYRVQVMKKKPLVPQLTAMLPENFSSSAILVPLQKRKDLETNLKAGMYFILDSIIKMSQYRKWRDYYDQHGGYPLYSPLLNKIIGKSYSKVIDLLEKSGVINRTAGYLTGSHSKLFTLTEAYQSSNYKIRPIPKAASLYKRLAKYRTLEEEINKEALSKIEYITKWFDPSRLTIDPVGAHALIEFYMSETRSLIPDPLPTNRTQEEVEARVALRANSMINTFHAIKSGNMGLKKTGLDNRLHSVVSNTKKGLRSLYRFDNTPLVSIDLKASQPYLLTQLLKPQSWEGEGLVSKIFPDLHQVISKPRYKKLLRSTLMFGASPETPSGKGFQDSTFFRFEWDKDFYQHLVDRARADGSSKIFPDRASVKRKMMLILFDSNSYMEKDEGFKLFARWFPDVAELISLLKMISRDAKRFSPEGEGLNFLPLLLQRLESYLMLEKVCYEVSKALPDAPIIPVHDCIMTTEQHAEAVRDIVKRVLESETGIIPGITIEGAVSSFSKEYVNKLAAKDMFDIIQKKSIGNHSSGSMKPPILYEPPDLEGDWLIHSRYDRSGMYFDDEVLIHLIDDTPKPLS